jgi:RimJ/RimL family protein N-acetyltransferase
MIQTNRLVLRDFVFPDFDAIHEYASDPLVTRFTCSPEVSTSGLPGEQGMLNDAAIDGQS